MRPPTCICGECKKCKHRLYMREWYARHPGYGAESMRRRRERNPEALREQDRLKMQRRRLHGTPEQKQKIAARTAVRLALARGDLVREPCEDCGATERVHAHHTDYDRPLDVRWKCRPCHDALHAEAA